jgi:hypothetical protein
MTTKILFFQVSYIIKKRVFNLKNKRIQVKVNAKSFFPLDLV